MFLHKIHVFNRKCDACVMLGLSSIYNCISTIRMFVYMVWLVHACDEQYRLGGEIKMKAFKWFFKGMYGRYLHLLNKANIGKLLHINYNCNFQTIFITLHHMHVEWKIFLIYCQYQFNDNNIILITIINQNLWF
jgi:hypothetical protein